jgi:hypothetical protein
MAFPRQTQQAFLEAHVVAFAHFGCVFKTIRYDNLTLAVKKVLRGRNREETCRFIALRSHYLFDSEFCLPGKEGAHEKGGVEGGGGRFRRKTFVPVPEAENYDALNRQLLDGCALDDQRTIEGRRRTIQEDWEQEKPMMRPLPEGQFPTEEITVGRVDPKGRVKTKTNYYSVPIGLRGKRMECRVSAMRVVFVHGGKEVASHERLQGRNEERLELDHYLELLRHKPGAMERSLPLKQARERGTWPPEYDRLFARFKVRFGHTEGTKHMLDVLMLHRTNPMENVYKAVKQAETYGCYDSGSISVLVRQLSDCTVIAVDPLKELGLLSRYDRPVATTDDYDGILACAALSQEVH